MKLIPVLLAITAQAMAAPSDPGQSAVEFLEKVRAKNLNLEPGADTALSPTTSEKKRKEIARRLERIGRDLGNDPLEVGAVKLDGDLAAVVVRKVGGFDPSRLQVFPVALVKRGADWAAAPVPASFENSGIGYAANLRKRLEALEEWMIQQRVLDLENLREQSASRMRRKIEETIPATTLRGFTSQQAVERFLSACEQRKLPEILGLLGGLAAALPDDWQLRLRAADTALAAASQVARPWRLLIAPEVLRVSVNHDEDTGGQTAMASIACLDPAANPPQFRSPKVELVHLELSKTPDGFWRVDPPAVFLQGTPGEDDETDEDLDSDLLDRFPEKLALKLSLSPAPTAGEACDALIGALGDARPAALARLIRTQGDPEERRKTLARGAQIWWETRNPAESRHATSLALHEDGNRAAAACQNFDIRNPDRLNLRFLFFEKTPAGWLWDPAPADETRDALSQWTDQQMANFKDHWQEALLSVSPKLETLPASPAPTEEESRKLVLAWLETMRTGDVRSALRLTARLDTPESQTTLLRNLGYEMTGARKRPQASSVIGFYQSEIWSAIGVRTMADGKPVFPFYPIIGTPSGPRILLEIDLLASGNRSRDFLNKTALDRLRKSSQPAADQLKKLLSEFMAKLAEKTQP